MSATSESKEWIFLATNLGLEILSAACDQASSPRRPHFALFGMLLAIAAVLISIGELIYKGIEKRVVFRKWWFYHPLLCKPFGTLPDIFGLVASISQCFSSMVQYVYCLRHADNPFKVSLLPVIFLVCLGASKLINNQMNANTTDNKDSKENSSSMVETSLHSIAIPDDQKVERNIEQKWHDIKQEWMQECWLLQDQGWPKLPPKPGSRSQLKSRSQSLPESQPSPLLKLGSQLLPLPESGPLPKKGSWSLSKSWSRPQPKSLLSPPRLPHVRPLMPSPPPSSQQRLPQLRLRPKESSHPKPPSSPPRLPQLRTLTPPSLSPPQQLWQRRKSKLRIWIPCCGGSKSQNRESGSWGK